jgi:hypothetical protein
MSELIRLPAHALKKLRKHYPISMRGAEPPLYVRRLITGHYLILDDQGEFCMEITPLTYSTLRIKNTYEK